MQQCDSAVLRSASDFEMRRVILLRHGATEANEAGLYCGSTDIPLSKAGKDELNRLRQTLRYPEIDGLRVYTSGMRRTEETLETLYGAVPHEAIPAFAEMNFGRFEMKSYESLKHEPNYIRWCSGENEKNRCPGGESGEEMVRRVLTQWKRMKGDFLLVAHGGTVAAIMAELFPEEGKSRYEWQPKNGRGYLLTCTDAGWERILLPEAIQ